MHSRGGSRISGKGVHMYKLLGCCWLLFMCVCVFVRLFVCLFVSLLACLPVCLFVFRSADFILFFLNIS